jgi:hypothetical protein
MRSPVSMETLPLILHDGPEPPEELNEASKSLAVQPPAAPNASAPITKPGALNSTDLF